MTEINEQDLFHLQSLAQTDAVVARFLEWYNFITFSPHLDSYITLATSLTDWNQQIRDSNIKITSDDKSFDRALNYSKVMGDLNDQLEKLRIKMSPVQQEDAIKTLKAEKLKKAVGSGVVILKGNADH